MSAVAIAGCLVACSPPAKQSRAPLPTCGWVTVAKTLPESSMRHTVGEAIGVLQLDPKSKVLGTEAAQAAIPAPLPAKLGLPNGLRKLWLVYTLDPPVTHTQAVVLPGAHNRILHIVDDATLQPGGAMVCPH